MIVVVGDALLDRDLDGFVERLAPDAPVPVVDDPVTVTRPGGAALAAVLAAADDEVVLVTALSDDDAAGELARLLAAAGVAVVDLGLQGRTPEKVRVRAAGRPLLRLDHGGPPGPVGQAGDAARSALAGARAVLVADYGRGLAAVPSLRRALDALPARTAIVWDPHPRGPEPVVGCRLVTPNRSEATRLVPGLPGHGIAAAAARAQDLASRWSAAGVAVTMGPAGAVLAGAAGAPLVVPAPVVTGGDPCGAGDRFASAAALALAGGAVLSEAVEEAVGRASRFVAAGGASSLGRPPAAPPDGPAPPLSAEEVVRQVRAGAGTVVTTGGCFDLLHAGHVAMLQQARRLGDCLVVCLNSDESVRRLKGPDRPLQPAADRAAVLLALDCVDAVSVFDDDTPVPTLERLRPDLFAKGGDYAGADLPEARTLAAWGGQAVVLPYLEGRSTTHLLQEVARRGA